MPRRCSWADSIPEFGPYHDSEWGFPVKDDVRLFEKMSLESFQSGLSWRTILNKREAFRRAFDGFEIRVVARYDEAKVESLLTDAGIVRHRGKIESVIGNASVAIRLQEQFGSLAAYVWQFEPLPEERLPRITAEVANTLATSDASRRLAKDLKKRGWRFFGPTTAYAFMQAMGLVNDHHEGCETRREAEAARASFVPPVPASDAASSAA